MTRPIPLDPGSTSQVKSDPPPCGLGRPIRARGRPGLVTVHSQSRAAVVPTPTARPPHAPAELHHAGFYQCISPPLEASWLGWRGLADLRLCVRRGGSADQRAALVSAPTVFISSCLVSSLTRYSSACRAAQAQSGPAHQFRFTCCTSVNKMSTVSSSARIRGGRGGEGRGWLARWVWVGG